MLPPGLRTPREVVSYYDQIYFSLIDSGEYRPFIYPWAAVGALSILIYLLIDHRQSTFLKWLRWPVFAFLISFQAWSMLTLRARNAASAFGVGLISCFGVLWTAAIMIVNDCQTDFKRIERSDGAPDEGPFADRAMNGAVNGTVRAPEDSSGLRQRTGAASETRLASSKGPAQRTGKLFWQAYPSSPFIERVDWIADVFCSFRGVGWSWQTSGVPPPPTWVEKQLKGQTSGEEAIEPVKISRTGIRRYSDRTRLVRSCVMCLVVGYLALDAIKTTMHNDPYFWGYIDAPCPSYMPAMIQKSHILTNTYRLLLSLSAVYTALWAIFKLGPVFVCGVIGPRWIGLRGEAWMNPYDMYGSYSLILDKGLTGWWSGWWHQVFRFAFEAPATRLMRALGVEKRSVTGKILSLLVAFVLSGCIHASGSYTQLGDTRPLMGPMRFFLLQGVAIFAQTSFVQLATRAGLVDMCPKSLRRLANLIVVHVWLYYTAPLLVDDFARGGVWLFEPVPFSPLRGLGFGQPGDQFFCWWNQRIWWWRGKHWWDTGIAL